MAPGERPLVLLGGTCIAPLLVAIEAGLRSGEGVGDVEGLLEGVADPLCGPRVLEVAGIAEQSPAWTGRFPEEPRISDSGATATSVTMRASSSRSGSMVSGNVRSSSRCLRSRSRCVPRVSSGVPIAINICRPSSTGTRFSTRSNSICMLP
jgi:hypothetical protein